MASRYTMAEDTHVKKHARSKKYAEQTTKTKAKKARRRSSSTPWAAAAAEEDPWENKGSKDPDHLEDQLQKTQCRRLWFTPSGYNK